MTRTLPVLVLFVALAVPALADPLEFLDRQDPLESREWLEAEGVTGDWLGLRPNLEDRGVEFFAGYIAEVWGNTTGGERTGAVYTGLLDFGVELNLESLVGWQGATVNTTWLWISGLDASEELVGNFLTISNIAGFQTLRMLELWFQQELWDERISVRFGQLAADEEFVISEYAALFLNGTFGWPAFMYMNLPGGGPAYPMGTLGARLAVHPTEWFSLLAGVFQGNVYEEDINRHGFRWRLNGTNGFFFLNEAQFRWNHREEETGLPGEFRGGFWAQSGLLADTLAASTNSGNYGVYFILDQMLYRAPGSALAGTGKSVATTSGGKSFKAPVEITKSDQGLGWFGRVAFQSPDRNFLNFYFDTGLSYKGLIPTRREDTLGLAFAYAQIGSSAGGELLEEGAFGIGAEMVLELTYQAQLTNWLIVQPDLQFIVNPGGTREFGNALVLGARAAITF